MFKIVEINKEYLIPILAIFQNSYLIDKISKSADDVSFKLNSLIKSIYIKNTTNNYNIYNPPELLDGLEVLENILNGKSDFSLTNIQKYVLSIILTQKKLSKNNYLKNSITKKIDNYQENSIMNANIIDLTSYAEKIYLESISVIEPRIIISGEAKYLTKNSSLIRALLLSGIRAAFLWEFMGGSKWHLVFRRREILKSCIDFKKIKGN